MAIIWRTSALAKRHEAIGGELEDWNGMGTAWFYDHTPERAKADYEAVRTKAGLMDVSGLKKMHLTGPHAAAVIDRVTTRNVDKIMPGRSVYACMLSPEGKFVDDCVIYRLSVNHWMVVHGTGTGMEQLMEAAAGKNVAVIFDDDLHDMSLQGPVAVDFLAEHVPGIRDLAYFGIMQTKLFDRPVMISRTGYTGERGYEIFCQGRHAVHIWDNILEHGKGMGIRPVQFSTLDLLRTESYLLFFPGDNSETYPFEDGSPCGDTLWELGLEFTVSPGKTGFVGAENHYALEGRERFKIYGVLLEGKTPADEGAALLQDGKQVGHVTYGMYSELNGHNVGIARMPVAAAKPGTKLTVRNADGTEIAATAQEMPFYDKDKKVRTAKG
ncbi:aminomethyltransferase family protein [Roseovarius sp. LXJ103]|uniref:aminomethyltransferase family protein n=1 Tax=Roseovarius carneus TaxID=2853164 RepID=UPI000D61DD7E|nr:aminomethyltransferase family protein [Roseovarius carneus]MBZ8118072.1 aminomethyltransferase family protein [Roseovarius carneus]PWE36184.1 aminomethyltransferase [Pelagicola sp. LXJ1103]